jgi:hypothetical protein
MRNTSLPQGMAVTTVVELMKSQDESKQLFDKYVSQKLSQGFTPRPDVVADWKSTHNEVWCINMVPGGFS